MSYRALVDHAAARATPELRERVRRIRRASDEHDSAERRAARAEIALAVHGIHIEHWLCPCGAAYTYPHGACPACKRDYPRRCTTPGCGAVSEPEAMVTAGGVACELVRTVCASCSRDMSRQSRAQSYARSAIPPRERAWGAQPLVAYGHQAHALSVIDEWVARGADSKTWKRDKTVIEASLGGTCALYLSGRAGSGKSVLAAYAVHRAFVDAGLVDDFRWHSQATLATLFAARHSGTDEQRGAALNVWQAVVDTPLLVIDDLFVSVPTPALAVGLASLIRERLDHARPTVITSNVPPHWGVYLEADDVGRLDSRWMAYGVELVVSGVDLRRAA